MIRVVLVDDDAELRQLLRIILRLEADFEVVAEAGDGKSAIAVTADQQPDLVLLDLQMPVMDGLEALPLIRQSAPDATVVVLSGFPSETMAGNALAAGATAYLSKGVAPAELVEELRQVMAR
jgi:DNA-binding NarL/FixJ family response regulator